MKQKLLSKPDYSLKKNNYWAKTILMLLFFALLSATKTQAQNPKLAWAKHMGGTTGTEIDVSTSVAVDAAGNVYTTGNFIGTADFDPNAGVYNLTSTEGYHGPSVSVIASDIFVTKLDAAGNLVWAKAMGGPDEDGGTSISTDAAGNVYITGNFEGTADFDPNAGVSNLTSAGSDDIFVTKLDAAGNLVWAKAMGGTSFDIGNGISIDAAGNVYTTGYFTGTADFDPNAGVSYLDSGSAGSEGIFVTKLDAAGNLVWAEAVGDAGTARGNGISIDAAGNLYTIGSFEGTAGTNYFDVAKLTAEGHMLWTRQMGGNNTEINGTGISTDTAGNVYITGNFEGTVDFDPDTGVSNLTSAGHTDVFVTKLNTTGNLVWAKAMGGTTSDTGNSISIDAAGNIYTTGYFTGTADFDPNAGVSNLTSAGRDDIFVTKLDTTGNLVWTKAMGGTGFDIGNGISIDAAGNVYTTGYFTGTADFDPNAGVSDLISAGGSDIFVHKMTIQQGAALHFDGGNDFVNIPYNSMFNFGTGNFSVEGWIKTTNTATEVVVGSMQTGDFWLGVENNKAVFSISGTATASSIIVNDGQWHHIAGVRNSGTISIYVDGGLSNRTANSSTFTLTSNPVTIGGFADSYYFNGSIDEVRIWNRALPQTEIQNTMNCELDASQTGLLAYYKFNSADSSTITSLKDSSGNNNTSFTLNSTISNWVTDGGVTTGNQCTAVAPLAITASQTNVTCFGVGNNGTATVVVSGGYSPYTYSWSPSGGTAATASGLTAGTYNCTVTDGSGSTTTQPFIIIAPAALPDHTTTITACDTYTWANNNQTYTESGTYTGTTTNCVPQKLQLTITSSSDNITTVSACDTYTWANNNQTYTQSGIYTGTTSNCVTEKLHLTITPSTDNVTTASVCDTYTWANNNQTYTASGTYTGTTTNCVTEKLHLTITPSSDHVTTASVCDTYTWANNNQTYTESGTYTGTTTNCVTEKLQLTITPATTNTTTVSVVGGYKWAVNGSTYLSSGTFTSVNNCNTQILNLTITPIDVTTTVNNGVITANQTNATYQWYHCDTEEPIANQTTQSFTPTVSGNYTVQVFVNDYNNFSNCVIFTTLGINTDTKISGIKLFPNPSTGIFNLELPKNLQVEVYNNLGQKILSQKSFTGTNTINISGKASGTYFLKAIEGNTVNTIKLIKK
jgi:hypothetical protein